MQRDRSRLPADRVDWISRSQRQLGGAAHPQLRGPSALRSHRGRSAIFRGNSEPVSSWNHQLFKRGRSPDNRSTINERPRILFAGA